MSEPLVSVVLPAFNRLDYLRLAVGSVYAQTFEDWEFIIVDDGSDEETRRYLQTLNDSRTHVCFRAHTGVPAIVRNYALERACGRYVAFIDSDDLWAADKLGRQLELMESAPQRRWSYTGVRVIDHNGAVLDNRLFKPWVPYEGSIIEELLRIDALIAMPTVMADLQLVRAVGGFDQNMLFSEDYDLWLRLALRSEVSVDATPLADVRTHRRRYTADRIAVQEGWVALYRKAERLMPTRSLRALSRRRMGHHLMLLAALQAMIRDWSAMRTSLLAAVCSGAWHPRDWLRVLKGTALSAPVAESRPRVNDQRG